MRLSSLNRKLLRDLLEMKGQALAIALVVAAGVAMYVMYGSTFESLQRTRAAYYQRQRFADVFASLTRAPSRLAPEIAAIPGVSAAATRVVAAVTLDVPGLDEPASGLITSIEASRRPAIDDLFVRSGRWIDGGRPDEVLASEAFVAANRLRLGGRIGAVINGRLRQLTIVGIALSPEHVYGIRPGEIVPDDRRFGVFWMERQALAAAFDMEGAFNDVALTLSPGASADAVIARLDRLLARYGGRGAIPRALQLSHWTVENELTQLQAFGFVLPLIFLGVAAFILNVALARALALQRPQIAALKALGYGNRALAWHYLKWAQLVAGLGVVAGAAAGAVLGRLIIRVYNQFFHFPELLYALSPGVVAGSAAMAAVAAAAGAFSAVRRAVRIPPAEAMRPEPPARYRPSIVERSPIGSRLGTAGRMVIRNLERHPFRAGASVVGIAFAGAILLVGFVFIDAMDSLITTQFSVAERQDVTVSFAEPRSAAARDALARLPGVIAVEPARAVPARIRAGHRHRNLAITGVLPGARLRRVVDSRGRVVDVPPSGLVLSHLLAEVLKVSAGDVVEVDLLEGRRGSYRLPVAGLVDDVLGLSAYMSMPALHELLHEGSVLSGAALLIDPQQAAPLSRRLKRLPVVAGAGFKSAVLRNFRDVLAANMNLSISLNVIFAGIIAFGVVYNAARVSLSERSRELASLRVLGFSRAEVSLILLGELALLSLAALPAGGLLGYGMAAAIVRSLDSEVYRFPLVVSRAAFAWSFLSVIAAALLSGLIVRQRLDRLDLVAVLKIRE
ncbi:MAG: ABC transporter permease [Acidobacteria bacterium]|nr:ABC transporter permease [Acidobacteriota bacterium]